MTGKYYAILINTGGRTVAAESIEANLRGDDWLRLNFNQYCIYSYRQPKDIWEALMTGFEGTDIVMVVEIVPAMGWVNTNPTIHGFFAKSRI